MNPRVSRRFCLSGGFPRLVFALVMLAPILCAPRAAVSAAEAVVPCIAGMAGSYPCASVDLLELVPLATLGAASANDLWGWSSGGREFALVGLDNGTGFVEITDPASVVVLGTLPTHTTDSPWRDVKVYADHALIVSEAAGHGMQVFDLTQLLTVVSPPVTFTETAHYPEFGEAHNVVVNEETGYAYAVGTATCSGGLHMVDLQNPLSPVFAGCFSADGYTHDAQCVVYGGPDATHVGREICFNANGDTLTIVDVESKVAPLELSRTGYDGARYAHQGWLTRNHRYFLLDDELDEIFDDHATYTYVFDVQDLDSPTLVGHFTSTSTAIDHNLYVRGAYVFQANYRSGLRILRIDDLAEAQMTQVAFFDTYPADDLPEFDGAWSVYPYFESGNVVVSAIGEGLFVLRPTDLPILLIADHEEGDTSDWTSTVE
jgi:choice-of-anchor B domain-containing protein